MLTQSVAGRTYDYDYNVGSRNMGMVINVAFGAGDIVYVLSRQHEQLADVPWNKTAGPRESRQVRGPRHSGQRGNCSSSSGSTANGDGELVWPTGIATDSDENVYVSDEWLNRVSVFKPDGELLGTWGRDGSGEGEFNGGGWNRLRAG